MVDQRLPRGRQPPDLLGCAELHVALEEAAVPLRRDLAFARIVEVAVNVLVLAEAVRETRWKDRDETLEVGLLSPTGDVEELLTVAAGAVQHEHHRRVRQAG